MEVIGTVAATAQLLGMVMKILESISQLHDLVKNVPGRYHSWDTQLTILGEIIYCIQRNSALQTFQVGRVIANMSPKIENLVLLCREHSPRSKEKPFKRVLTTLSACAVEPRIFRRFESLEQDKTTLLLAINVRIVANPLAIEDMSKRPYEEIREGSTRKLSDAQADTNPADTVLVLAQKKDTGTFVPGECGAHAPGNQYKRHNQSSAHQYDTREFVVPQQKTSQRSTYTALKLEGNNNVVGTSRGDGAVFNEIEVKGHHHVIGDHHRDVIGNVFNSRKRTGPKQTRRRSRRNVSSSSSIERNSTKSERSSSTI